MCGRFALHTDTKTLLKQFPVAHCDELPLSYNVAPTENALCLINNETQINSIQMRWGFIPWYLRTSTTGKKPQLLINARAETILEKPAFKQAVQYRRCVLIISGFFEWQQLEGTKEKQPYFIEKRHHELLAIAAIWQRIQQPKQDSLPSFCLLTTKAANPTVAALHDRMPWMLSAFQTEDWLRDEQLSATHLKELLDHDEPIDLIAYPVTQAVNSAKYKEKDSIKPQD
ncbi:putative SOS response-associated peptidase YedK [Legionella nautarum]|uniref:Abasic site processing protein n=1 Tax=Legionella nautarum TaxID=45070 RepID=A0A0W0WIJ7_9GAMM|nr:SOS response-associated peptidase [Legionella nautarum]KTD32157.1 putative SOS response-associated peptidase YedK [Legionella nautarum]